MCSPTLLESMSLNLVMCSIVYLLHSVLESSIINLVSLVSSVYVQCLVFLDLSYMLS